MANITLLSDQDLDAVSGGRAVVRDSANGGTANGGIFADRGGEVGGRVVQANGGVAGGGGGNVEAED